MVRLYLYKLLLLFWISYKMNYWNQILMIVNFLLEIVQKL